MMLPDEALRFLTMLGVEYAQSFADAKMPAVQETLLMRIDASANAIKRALEDRSGDPQT